MNRILSLMACLAALTALARAQTNPSPHASAALVAESTSIAPGRSFRVALRLELDSGWHTYWRNPGDAGIPTRFELALPDGFTADEPAWPVPESIGEPPEVTYGHHGTLLLPVTITPPTGLRPGDSVRIAARASWLVCLEKCLPGRADLTLVLPVSSGEGAQPGRWVDEFHAADARAPASAPTMGVSVRRIDGFYELTVASLSPLPSTVTFFAYDEAVIDHSADQVVSTSDNSISIKLRISPYESSPSERLRGILVATEDPGFGGRSAMEIDTPIGHGADATVPDNDHITR